MTQTNKPELLERLRRYCPDTSVSDAATEPQRRAFIAGYNGEPCPRPITWSKRFAWEDGRHARNHLIKDQSHEGQSNVG